MDSIYKQMIHGIEAIRKQRKTMYILRGVTRDGDEVFYTGKAGQEFVSSNRGTSFGYVSQLQARNRATNLNQMTPIHGVWFVAIQSDEVSE